MWLTRLKRKRAAKICQLLLPFINPNIKIIDIGCGKGYIAECLYSQSKKRPEITGLDIQNKLETKIPFVLYDRKKIPFQDKEFDLGLLIFILHHSQEEGALLIEAKRVSKKLIILEDVYSNFLDYLITIFMDFLSNLGYGSFKFKKIEEWEKFFSRYNLKVLEKKEFKINKLDPVKHCLFLLD